MATIKVKGMTCQHCVQAVTQALSGLEGVENVKVSLSKGEASFEETKPVDMEEVKKAVKEAGYKVEG
ncbi:MAG: copper ion binding protein [Desulfovermiculus sp.]